MAAMASARSQIDALIHLLCVEEGSDNQRLLRQKLLEMGEDCIPELRRAMGRVGSTGQAQIQSVLSEMRWAALQRRFVDWAGKGRGLEEGVFLLAEFGYPALDIGQYSGALDAMAREVRARVGRRRKGREVMETFIRYVFRDLGFSGNRHNYYDPDNSYLNRILDERVGIPISLSVLLLLVGARLRLPIVGVGLPGHFLTRFDTKAGDCYIDAFNRGRILTREECMAFVRDAGFGYREEYFVPASPVSIVARMIRNLIYVYDQLGDAARVKWLSRYVGAIAPTSS